MSRSGRLSWIACTLVAVAALAVGCAPGSSFNHDSSDFTPTSIRGFSEFPLYWVGTRFEGLPLVFINGPSFAARFVTFVYGTCTPRPQDDDPASCGSPLVIQIQRLCVNLEVATENPIWRDRRVRGAHVGYLDTPVLFTNRVQVKVYASSVKAALHVMHELRSANRVAPVLRADEPIPAAARSVLSGERPC